MLLYGVGYLGLFGFRLTRELWCQARLYRRGSTSEEKEMTKKELLSCFSGEEAGGEGAVDPVSEQRRQEEKGEAATQDRNMAVVVFLSQTAVILTKRSSSHPRGVRLESPNLSAALLDLVAYGRLGLHSAATVMSVYMLCSCKAMMLISVFQTRPPCIHLHPI